MGGRNTRKYALIQSKMPVVGLLNHYSLRYSDIAVDRSIRIQNFYFKANLNSNKQKNNPEQLTTSV